jgi:hypothetical protein
LPGEQTISFGCKVLAIRSIALPLERSNELVFEHDYRDLTSPKPFDDLRNIGIPPIRRSMPRVVATWLQDDNSGARWYGRF